jgi:hypothetical protein
MFRAFLEPVPFVLSDMRQINRYSTHANLAQEWVSLKKIKVITSG